jgi:hypothetical protein
VYILAPFLGGSIAAISFRFLVSRLMGDRKKACCGQDGSCDASNGGEANTTRPARQPPASE